jgi:predicted nucleic acid-binding protein
MTSFFMDTSAIVKRYVSEVGTAWITAQARPTAGNIIVIARLTTVEVCSTLTRLQRL